MNIIQTVAQMYDIRAKMRRLFGDAYEGKVHEFKGLIRRQLPHSDVNHVKAAMDIAKDFDRHGHPLNGVQLALLVSACVELDEEKMPPCKPNS